MSGIPECKVDDGHPYVTWRTFGWLRNYIDQRFSWARKDINNNSLMIKENIKILRELIKKTKNQRRFNIHMQKKIDTITKILAEKMVSPP